MTTIRKVVGRGILAAIAVTGCATPHVAIAPATDAVGQASPATEASPATSDAEIWDTCAAAGWSHGVAGRCEVESPGM